MATKPSIKMRVLKRHFDAAVRARKLKKLPTSVTCLLAQAARDAFSSKKVWVGHIPAVSVGFNTVTVEARKMISFYDLDSAGKNFIRMFDDSHSRSEIRASLPTTVMLTLCRTISDSNPDISNWRKS